jgi:hypothetical protein
MGGKNPMAQLVKEMHQAMLEGKQWGDIVFDQEQEALALESPEEAVARLMKVEKQDEKAADNLKQYTLQRLALINTDAKTGTLKHKSGRCCRDAEEPAKWVVGKKKLGNYEEWAATDPKAKSKPSMRPKCVPANAIFWSYGCEPHTKGCCPHLHPDEAGYQDAKAGKKPNVEAILAKAVYITKALPKPSLLKQQVSIMQDAW